MTTSTWMLVSGELCATSGNEFVLAFPSDQVHALKGEKIRTLSLNQCEAEVIENISQLMPLQSGNGVDVERSVFPPRTHFVFGVLWMEMTTSTWMLVSGELCATSGNEFVLAFPTDQVHALKRESNG
ncbi:hypothetical protein CEXT_96471 [Caerostris extrusa]|uniref:Uncharacterized protein n=1 Tax=Caerostris extrusa TaxID=172846 RepID=A0AAV4T6K3_CAEEX|nr:hypothetical protein CEXT_96471 [Caerostris extrusa]